MAYKLSYYVIETDPFSENLDSDVQRQIIFSTRSSQALVISSEISEKIHNGNWDDLPDDAREQLVRLKFLVPEEEDELGTIIGENKRTIADESLLYYVIQPTANCQLGCDYCGQAHNKHNIKEDLYDKLLDRIKSKYVKGKHRHLKIGWFGGEPLLALKQIRALTKLLREWAASEELSYQAKIVTNGLSLKEGIFIELNNELGIKEIEVTLDGIAEFHDNRRHTKEKESTFDIIFNNLKTIVFREDFPSYNCKISLRCNVDKRNWEGVSPLIKLLADNKFHERISYFYPIGVYSWGNQAHLGSLTKEEFAEKEIDWLIEMYQYGFKPNLLPGRVNSVCLAVSNTAEMVDAYGNYYNCTEVSYVPTYENSQYVLGNLKLEHLVAGKPRQLSDWNDQILHNGIPCSSCKMLPVCGGACPKSWSEGMRACPTAKFNIKEKLMLSYFSTMEKFDEAIQELN